MYWDLIGILSAGEIETLVGKMIETIRQAIESNMEDFKRGLICRLFGSQDEYERVLKIEWPRAD